MSAHLLPIHIIYPRQRLLSRLYTSVPAYINIRTYRSFGYASKKGAVRVPKIRDERFPLSLFGRTCRTTRLALFFAALMTLFFARQPASSSAISPVLYNSGIFIKSAGVTIIKVISLINNKSRHEITSRVNTEARALCVCLYVFQLSHRRVYIRRRLLHVFNYTIIRIA